MQRQTTYFAWRISGCRSQGLGRRRPPRLRSSSFGSISLAFSIATPFETRLGLAYSTRGAAAT
eukprot:1383775-Pleurochrysis_carterae.AAC.1